MTRAVFLSYASHDADVARKICDTLRAAGIEVWFDQSELVGGDAWDRKIRRQIQSCALFVPIISAATQARSEGYFRLEWRLAEQRTHLMAKGRPFLLPIVIDGTTEAEAHVPDAFLEVQWSRLPGGEFDGRFAERVQQLLSSEIAPTAAGNSPARAVAVPGASASRASRRWLWFAVPVAIGALTFVAWPAFRHSVPSVAPTAATPAASPAASLVAQARALLDDPMRVKENYRAAEDLAARAVALDPQSAEAWAVYADVASGLIAAHNDQSERQRANARTRAERAIRLAPDSLDAALAMARYELAVGDKAEAASAEARLRAWQARAPEDKRVLRLLAIALAGQDKLDEAISSFDLANRLPGGDAQALAWKAWAFWRANRLPEMEQAADASLARSPNTDAYGAKLILLMAGLGDLARTRALIETLPPTQWREDRVAFLAYEMWMNLRQPDKAADALRRLDHDFIAEGRITMPTRFGVGNAQQLAGRASAAAIEYESALSAVTERLRAEPSSVDLNGWRTLLLARLGRMPEAQQSFRTTLELRGLKPDELSKIGARTLIAVGRYDDAVTALQLRLRAGSRDTTLLYLHTDPDLDPLRKLPRFQALLKESDEKRSAPR